MPTELQIKPIAKACYQTGRGFAPGDKVSSFLLRKAQGEYERVDMLAEAAGEFHSDSPVLCRWTQSIKDKADADAEARKQRAHSAEEAFVSLFEGEEERPAEGQMTEDRETLKFVLGFMLERKRVLRLQDQDSEGFTFLHIKQKKNYRVPVVEVTPERLLRVQEQLSFLA